MKNLKTNALAFMALAVVINFAACNLALIIKAPIYMDAIGTVLTGIMLGPAAGAGVGACTTFLNGVTVDPISLYFIPVQACVGMTTGLLFKSHRYEGFKSAAAIVFIGFLCAVLSSFIVAFIFDGVTSSGSSLIVAALSNLGIDKFLAVFSTQIVTDILDKIFCFAMAFAIIKILPSSIKLKITPAR